MISLSKLSVRMLFVVFAVGLAALPRANAGELILIPTLTNELNRILKVSDSLHRSLMAQSEDQIEISLRDMIWQIDQARAATGFLKAHERGHLLLILDSAREQFEQTQTTYGEERRARLEEAFNQLANLVRIYRLDRSFAIFFCPDDKTSWVQKGMKGQNPFRPRTLRDCGIRVVNSR